MLQFLKRAAAAVPRPKSGAIRLFFDEAGAPKLMNDAGAVTGFAPGSGADWGAIGGTLTDQADLVAYIAARLAELIDTAPGALDTLNELAAAIGDDANFAATITAALAGKQATLSALGDVPGLTAALAAKLGQFGFVTGDGGTVTQATSKATAVTLNKPTGQITMNNAALAAGAIATFVLNDSAIAATDMILVTHHSGGTIGPYLLNGRATGAGTASISVRNTSAASLSEAIVLKVAVIKAVTA